MIFRLLILAFFVLGVLESESQISVSLGWGKDSIQLGDEVALQLSIINRADIKVESVNGSFLDSIISGFQTAKMRQIDSTKAEEFGYADIDILHYGNFNDQNENGKFEADEMNWQRNALNDEVLLSNSFKVRIWEPGQIIALSPKVEFQMGDEVLLYADLSPAMLFVIPPVDVESIRQDSIGISPIKTIIKEPVQLSDYAVYFYFIGGVLGFWLVYVLYGRNAQKKELAPIPKVQIVIPAHKIALGKLHELDDKKLWQTGNIKGYQSELTYIVREYLENRYGVIALEMTTDEIVQSLKKRDLEKHHIDELRNILQVADLVKFAKSKPNVNIHREFMDKAVTFVKETQQVHPVGESLQGSA